MTYIHTFKQYLRPLLNGPAILWFLILITTAWVVEDSYISFRQLEQLFAGNGLVWNLGERVQVFTSPAWFALCILTRILISDPFWMTMAMGFTFGILLFLQLTRFHNYAATSQTFLWISVFLASLNAGFFDYIVSGLENPLFCLLLGSILWQGRKLLTNGVLPPTSNLFKASTAFGLLALTRHDQILLPSLFYSAWWFAAFRHLNWRQRFGSAALVMSPIIFWSAFSLIYFGMLLPNTAYAKLLNGISNHDLWICSLNYYLSSIIREPLLIITIITACLCLLLTRNKGRIFRLLLLAGILLQLGYVAVIGADYMLGRFFGGTFWAALMITNLIGFPLFERLLTKIFPNRLKPLPLTTMIVISYLITAMLFHPERLAYRYLTTTRTNLNNDKSILIPMERIEAPPLGFHAKYSYTRGMLLDQPFNTSEYYVLVSENTQEEQAKKIASLPGLTPQIPHLRYYISNERLYYSFSSSLLSKWLSPPQPIWPSNGFSYAGEKQRQQRINHPETRSQTDVAVFSNIGFSCYFSGLDIHFIDSYGLADPYLARLPSQPDWRIGHYRRTVPPAYIQSIAEKTNRMETPAERELLNEMWTLTRDPLWTAERWKVIRKHLF